MKAAVILAVILCVVLSLRTEAGQARGNQGSTASGSVTASKASSSRSEGGRSSGQAAAGQPSGRPGGDTAGSGDGGSAPQAPFTSRLDFSPQHPSSGRGHAGRGWGGGWGGVGVAVPFDPFWWSAPPPETDAAPGSNDPSRSLSGDFARPPSGPSSIQPAFRPPALAIISTSGTLRLNVQPSSAQLYVDGFYVGIASEFDASGPGLALPPGWHRLEFRATGYLTPAVNVTIDTGRTTTYEGVLQPTQR